MATPRQSARRRGEEQTTTPWDQFAGTCELVEVPRGFIASGTCPRCGDLMSFPYVTKVFRNVGAPGGTGDLVRMLCTCEQDHPGKPDGECGYGAFWNVRLSG
jgi:hypothetical protein